MQSIALPLLCALAMSYGWGFRGDYGHEAGAMVPGALVAMAGAIAAGRSDWVKRAGILGMLGAIGWAFGGSMSYGMVIGYTMQSPAHRVDVIYGFACLFLIGALWGGIGAAILGTGLTRRRSEIESVALPLVVLFLLWKCLDAYGLTRHWTLKLPDYLSLLQAKAPVLGERLRFEQWPRMLRDADWVAALSALVVGTLLSLFPVRYFKGARLFAWLAFGWIAGFAILRGVFNFQMTPPRGDNWAGCAGVFVALILWLLKCRDYASLRFVGYGFVWGGIGFAVADFIQVLGRGNWGPIGKYEVLQKLNYWKWMEQSFGLLMGFGIGLGLLRLKRDELSPPEEDSPCPVLAYVAPLTVFLVVPWQTFPRNVATWLERGVLAEPVFRLRPEGWTLIIGGLLTAMVVFAIARDREGKLHLVPNEPMGRAQFGFLMLLWLSVLAAFTQALMNLHAKGSLAIHASFWITAGLASLIAIAMEVPEPFDWRAPRPSNDRDWIPGIGSVVLWLAVCSAMIFALGYAATSFHDKPLGKAQPRFQTQ